MTNKIGLYIAAVVCGVLCSCLGSCRPDRESVAEERPAAEKVSRVRLLFTGDVMCHMPQVYAAETVDGYDFRPAFEAVKPYFDRADVSIVNLETVVSPDGRYSGYPAFSSPAELIDALKWAGADVVVMANNHCCDRGKRGIVATTRCLDDRGIARTGVFRDSADMIGRNPLRFSHNGIDFAILNYTYGTNGLNVPDGCVVNSIDTTAMLRDLRRASDADCIIACMHWGGEYVRRENREQRRIAEFLCRNGVSVIVGSHPHVVQPADASNDRVIVWSLGNFVSNQRKRYCDGGLIAEIEVEKRDFADLRFGLRLTPVWVSLPEYRIIPPECSERIAERDRAVYERFMYDTEELLSLQPEYK